MDVNNSKKDKKNQTSVNIGEQLVEARDKKNFSSQDIASQLNLTLSVITGIENNQFEQDIPIAFIRGYLRSYAQKVGADVETLCVEFDRQINADTLPIQKLKVVSNFSSSRKEVNSSHFIFKLITFLIVVSLLAFGGWTVWKKVDFSKNSQIQPINEITLNTEQSDDSSEDSYSDINLSENSLSKVENSSTETTEDYLDSPIDDETSLNEDTNVLSANLNQPVTQVAVINQGNTEVNETDNEIEYSEEPLTENALTLLSAEFTFSDDCWVKITDAKGEVLAVGIKTNGKTMQLKGAAPLSIILGNPQAVELSVNGTPFDLSGFRPGKTANFTVE